MHSQEAVGMTQDQMATINGHVNPNTCQIYLRDQAQKMATHGGDLQSMATGIPVTTMPDFSYCHLMDGTRVYPKMIITTKESGSGKVKVRMQGQVQEPQHMDLSETGSYSESFHFIIVYYFLVRAPEDHPGWKIEQSGRG